MTPFEFVILALATWRIANMLVDEDGPWMIFEHLRLKAGLQPAFPDGTRETDPPGQMPGSLFTCVWCMSVWVAAVWIILFAISHLALWLAFPFALSAIACLLNRWDTK